MVHFLPPRLTKLNKEAIARYKQTADLQKAKEVYNASGANKATFIENIKAQYRYTNDEQAEQYYNTLASMDKDDTPGLTHEEYKDGLIEKKDAAEIRRDNLINQYVPENEKENFVKMSQFDKFEYIKSKIPHEAEQDTEAQIMAELVLSKINNLDAEIKYFKSELMKEDMQQETNKAREDTIDQLNKEMNENQQKEKEAKIHKSFNGLS